MALLLFSQKCAHSRDIIEFIQGNAQLAQIVRYHDVNRQGVPQQYQNKITRVPTMLTTNGKMLVGAEIKQWLESLLPPTELENCQLGGGCGFASSLEGEDDQGLFNLGNYGQSLQPAMTSDLRAKIEQKVTDAYQQISIKK
jgi:hypothetical protein